MVGDADIVYVFSGGSSNFDPKNSLGGDPSSVQIPNGLNNLFDNVSEKEAIDGVTDYRCFYIFNNSLIDTLFNCNLYVEGQNADGSTVSIGLLKANEVQRVTVVGAATGGSLQLAYDTSTFTFAWNASPSVWATNLKNVINSLPGLSGVTVNVSQSTSLTTFELTFQGDDANRFHPLVTLASNDLTPSVGVTTSRVAAGSPINAITTLIDKDTTTPAGIVFSQPTVDEPLVIGHLRPAEGFPVWLKRVTPAGTIALAGDSFSMVCAGTAFE